MKYYVEGITSTELFDNYEEAKVFCWSQEIPVDEIIEINADHFEEEEKRNSKLKSLWYELCDFIEYDLFDYAVIGMGLIIVITNIVLAVLTMTTTI